MDRDRKSKEFVQSACIGDNDKLVNAIISGREDYAATMERNATLIIELCTQASVLILDAMVTTFWPLYSPAFFRYLGS